MRNLEAVGSRGPAVLPDGDAQARPGGVSRYPSWLSTSGGAAATWLHVPASSRARSTGVVVCPPFGYEYTHAHRSLLHLADALASAGFVAMRIDYLGTGDSQGDARTPDLFERWLETIEVGAGRLQELTGGVPTLLGLRLGALLAATAASRIDVQHLVAWHPVVSGRRYMREHEALQQLGKELPERRGDILEAGGFILARETVAAIKAIDLTRTSLRVRGQALVLQRDDVTPDPVWPERLEEQGIRTRTLAAAGYLEMMAEPQYTAVPGSAIRSITDWLVDLTPREAEGEISGQARRQWLDRTTAERAPGREAYVEEQVHVPLAPDTRLFGVLNTPRAGTRPGAPVVVLCNSGSVHHVGPHRLYVELARALAADGVASLRLDLRNLGDSRTGVCRDENHPYPDSALEDVGAALAWLASERGLERFVVAGLCSGAHTAFHAGLELASQPIAGVICINPLTFHWAPGMSLDTPAAHQTTRDAQYYGRAMRDRAKWAKLLRGQVDFAYIRGFVVRRGVDRVRLAVRNLWELLGLGAPGRLACDLAAYEAAHRPLHFVFSGNDPGHAILMSEAGRTARRLIRQGRVGVAFVEGADHTFSRERRRTEAVGAVRRSVRRMGDPASAPRRETMPYHEGLWGSLEPAWSTLCRQTGDPSAFLSCTWTAHWLEAFGPRLRPTGIVWRDQQGRPLACVLISRSPAKLGPFPISRAYLNASGIPGVGCEHNDVLVLPAFRDTVLDDLVRVVTESGAHELALVGFRERTAEELRARWPEPSWEGYVSESPYVSLEGLRAGGESYLSTLSANTRSQVRRSLRLYEERFGPPTVRVAERGEAGVAWFDEMVALHAEHWQRRGAPGAFADEQIRQYHAHLIDRAPEDGHGDGLGLSVDLLRIEFGAETIGFLYHLRYHGKVSFYQSGLRYDDDNRLKPGLVAHALAIQHYIETAADEYDFLGGEVDPVRYKRSLATGSRTLAWIQLPAPSAKMRVLRRLRHARRRLRSTLPRSSS